MMPALRSLLALKNNLEASFLERRSEIRGLLVALLAREHVLLIGPPGTAKSELASSLCSSIGGPFFQRLISAFTDPSELFGPLSLSKLEQDRYCRMTRGYLPEANVAFLDEALALDTPMFTPDGWTTIGDLRVGDRVFGDDGEPVLISALTPIVEQGDCYRVTFRDGSTLVADAGHKWSTVNHAGTARVMTTAEMGAWLAAGAVSARRRLTVPVAKPLQLSHADLSIDPYVLGLWLGNGNRWNGEIYIRDVWAEETLRVIQQVYPQARISGQPSEHLFTVSMAGTGFRTSLREAGLVQSSHYSSKAVPVAYLRASPEQRLALLRGLMDTDGYLDAVGTCTFSNTNENIVDAAVFLVRSLGIRCTKNLTNDTREGSRPCWKVTFRADPEVNPFMARPVKIPRLVQSGRNAVVSVEPVDPVPVRCITVDNASHLFLAGEGLTVTHNCFKGNSAVLNAMLTVINERQFDNDGERQAVPLEMVVGASNEFPADESLDAFYDRFLLRFVVDRLTPAGLRLLLSGRPSVPPVQVAPEHLAELRELTDGVEISDATLDTIFDIKRQIDMSLSSETRVSDRRWRKALGAIRASAALRDSDESRPEDCHVLKDILWYTPNARARVDEVVSRSVETHVRRLGNVPPHRRRPSRAREAAARAAEAAEAAARAAAAEAAAAASTPAPPASPGPAPASGPARYDARRPSVEWQKVTGLFDKIDRFVDETPGDASPPTVTVTRNADGSLAVSADGAPLLMDHGDGEDADPT